ncbi:DUF2922 domain-containing protein [Enterococcus sp. AZ109]|uniref:DUF2922 domain-containing protein n=1 Tax=Enterococcus sp. AZ109 TaxID=2774634 RepID=UPI003F26FE3F
MIKLVGTFLNDAGKKHNLIMKDPNIDLSPEVVKENLELLTTLDLFEKDGVALFQEVVSAQYVETIETPIFEKEEFFGDANEPVTLNQSLLNRMPVTEQVEVPEEKKVEEVDNQQKLEEMKAQSNYREIPRVSHVPLSKKGDSVVASETDLTIHDSEESQIKELAPKKRLSSYNFIKEMFHRRNRHQQQARYPDNPHDPPSAE